MPALHLSTRRKIQLARLLHRVVRAARRSAGRPMTGHFQRHGLRWSLDLNEGIDFAIWLFGAFEREVLQIYERELRPGAVVLDLGANIGAHTLPLARTVGASGRVLAVEATAWAYQKLRTNVALNPDLASRVTAVQALLVAQRDATVAPEIHSSWPLVAADNIHPVLGGVPKSTAGSRAVTVDDLLAEVAPGPVSWVKLDVDGHELPVLQGAGETLQRDRPTIIMEFAPYCHDGDGFERLIAWLLGARYALFRAETRRPLPPDAALLRRLIPQEGSINVIARPA